MLTNPTCGGRLLSCDGVDTGKVQRDADTEKKYVPRDSR